MFSTPDIELMSLSDIISMCCIIVYRLLHVSCDRFVCLLYLIQEDTGADKENAVLPPGGGVPTVKNNEENMIDNPYLRPVKKPKVRRKK